MAEFHLFPFLPSLWSRWTDNLHPIVVMGLGTFIWHQIFWLALNLPYMIIEDKGLFEQYRVNKSSKYKSTSKERWDLFWTIVKDQHVMLLPLLLVTSPLLLWIGITVDAKTIPSLYEFSWQFLLFNIVEDTGFYWVHRLLHHPELYKRIHSKHHSHIAPFSLAGEVAHPAEFLFNFLMPFALGPILVAHFYGSCHILIFWAWMCFREARGVEAHSGYHLPFHPLRLLPLYGGAKYHGTHHSLKGRQSNYGGYLFWDWICGTVAHDISLE